MTNKEITQVLRECKLFHHFIEHPEYIKAWTQMPDITYDRLNNKSCRQLKELISLDTPLRKDRPIGTYNVARFRENQPIQTFEAFGNPQVHWRYVLVGIILLAIFVLMKK